ncbi:hypothetical protein CRG98_003758 [Punica granatum]|uniref:RNase H type-1 domain-containing protein n=1 Tax=Punica granatum TaxID=22663 RepID=A0A2I0L5E6_PUNGR|nr:hypothetical protein CRG98_003758 [Punica granatum]
MNDEEEAPGWKMYFDGAVNSTGSGIGAVLISPEGHHFPVAAKIDFPCTNNIVEYEACILGLQAAVALKVKELEVFGDSMLAIFQTLKQWKTKDPKLVPYHEYLEELIENFEDISFTYTPRMKNQFADALATLASMGPAHCDVIDAVDGKPWYADIKHLLQTGQFPAFTDRHDRRTLRRIAAHFFLSGETLYRRSFDATMLRCVDESEAQRLMEEVHEGNYGPHMNGLMLAKKLMRLGYFWSTMEIDYVKHLNLIDERRLTALCHGQCYQQRMARTFNKKVRPRKFSPDNLVLRKVLHIAPDSRGKFAYKYDGPFIVEEVFDGGAIILNDLDGNENALPVSADAKKKYYP